MKTLRAANRAAVQFHCAATGRRGLSIRIYSMGNPRLQCNISGAEPKSVSTTCRYGKHL